MADLPGPKIRIGQFGQEPIQLKFDNPFTLTAEQVKGAGSRVSVNFEPLPGAVKPGDTVFLNDGFIQLEVVKVEGKEVRCRVLVVGELRSRKGLNLPGIDLGVSAFTERDREGLKFAAENAVDAVSQSFVQTGADIDAVRRAAETLDYHPLIMAKIERSRALDRMDEILKAADGIMIARGDLGVEIPIEQIAVVPKRLMRQANLLGKPVITATQMLEAMTENPRPTRAESTDVANAVLDGTDCVMPSGESAMGKYPVEAVAMLAKIAEAVIPHRPAHHVREALKDPGRSGKVRLPDVIAFSVETTLERIFPATVFVPTRSGYTARSIARFRLPFWIAAVSSQESTCQRFQFSYGGYPVHELDYPEDWKSYIRKWLHDHGVEARLAVVTEGPSTKHPEASNRMEIIDLRN
jgi:pyruvate kinase